MTTWYSKSLGDATLAHDAIDNLKHLCLQHAKPDAPVPTVYLRHETRANLYCEAIVYFPPSSKMIAEHTGALPCDPPDPQGLSNLTASNHRCDEK